MYRVTLTPEAARDLDRLPLTIRARMPALFDRLESWPRVSGAKPLRGDRAAYFRLRTGDYRLVFYVAGSTLVVERIEHRRDVYED
jgi:mRNA-degrading endonuclease RelE of RelBE toxin-antitoxin system